MNLRNKVILIFVQPYKKSKVTCCCPKKAKNLLKWNLHLKLTICGNISCRGAKNRSSFVKKIAAPESILIFDSQKKSLRSATVFLFRSLMVYNTTASLAKLTCTDYVAFEIKDEIKTRTLSCCAHNSRNIAGKNYTHCSWNETTNSHWKDWFERTIFLPNMDNIQCQVKSTCKIQDL